MIFLYKINSVLVSCKKLLKNTKNLKSEYESIMKRIEFKQKLCLYISQYFMNVIIITRNIEFEKIVFNTINHY